MLALAMPSSDSTCCFCFSGNASSFFLIKSFNSCPFKSFARASRTISPDSFRFFAACNSSLTTDGSWPLSVMCFFIFFRSRCLRWSTAFLLIPSASATVLAVASVESVNKAETFLSSGDRLPKKSSNNFTASRPVGVSVVLSLPVVTALSPVSSSVVRVSSKNVLPRRVDLRLISISLRLAIIVAPNPVKLSFLGFFRKSLAFSHKWLQMSCAACLPFALLSVIRFASSSKYSTTVSLPASVCFSNSSSFTARFSSSSCASNPPTSFTAFFWRSSLRSVFRSFSAVVPRFSSISLPTGSCKYLFWISLNRGSENASVVTS